MKPQPRSIFVIEPVLRLRSSLEATLRQGGCRATCEEGFTGVDRIEQDAPDLVLLSCETACKGLDCFDICALLVQSRVSGAVIMMSAKPTKEMVIRAVRCGAKGFIVVPLPGQTLFEQLNKTFSRCDGPEDTGRFPIIDFGTKPLTNPQKVDIIMKGATAVRALPHAVTRVLRAASASDTGAGDISKAADSDPTIAAMILKRANSSFYGAQQITDLQSAVVRMGFKECRDVVVGLSVCNLFSREERSFGFNRIWYWLHSVACGILAKEIAGQVSFEHRGDAFSVGLLHDIGKMILDDFLNRPYQEVVQLAQTQRITMQEAEMKMLERDHALVGSMVAERWRFPDSVCRAIGGHHERDSIVQRKTPDLVGAVYLANLMAKVMLVGNGGDFIVLDTPDDLWARFGFTRQITDRFLNRVYDELKEFCSFLQIRDAQIEQALERRTASGPAAVLDPEGRSNRLLSLFLANQGFTVECRASAAEIQDLDPAPKLCLMRAASLEEAQDLLSRLESTAVPTVCVLPPQRASSELCTGRGWVRVLHTPLDCFELLCKVRELMPELRPAPHDPTPAAAMSR